MGRVIETTNVCWQWGESWQVSGSGQLKNMRSILVSTTNIEKGLTMFAELKNVTIILTLFITLQKDKAKFLNQKVSMLNKLKVLK
jgi:hypothetical protein